ncbi:glycoside hydrolase family 18 [Streptomyces venezuelae]|uniref:ricin-type beta-trefoil lectin domain protein n=1 Tax=Streptomyces gardneri TaxID=66892 RepID=UPI0006BDF1B8|nr:ricin-type beta-trefoil lectin domain protein [Streptomyces gardneri]ALO05940.1 glycoside hydrolase family 18 [Streptomyces venezuelae]QPK43459.1 RICIN domain-containing protein [Streptomyces gardneri]WRK34690.1 RICIN domain-containing protein [Streptomyces venezuelae]CUM43841.1 putative secreted hydrolase [Streptomyces venezuelae]
MRRTAALLATALLAWAAALTAPAAHAVESPSAAAAQSAATVPGPGGVGSCTEAGASATCTGLDPMQTWSVGGTCATYDFSTGFYTFSQAWSGWVRGDTTTSASCFGTGMWWGGGVSFGPAVPAGPVGQVTGLAGKCLDVRGGSMGNKTPTQIWDCLGNVNQRWKIGADGTIRAVGVCLDIWNGRTNNGTQVHTGPCNGNIAQQWRVQGNGAIVNTKSGRCLDVRAFDSTNGNVVQIWDCNGSSNQIWQLPV